MGDRGVIFFRLDSRQLSAEHAMAALRHMAVLVNGTAGDGSSVGYNLQAGIRPSDDGVYWVGFNARYWGKLFELVLVRYRVSARSSDTLPGGDQPILRNITSRHDIRCTLPAPLTEEEQKMSAVDEALDLLGHAMKGARRRRRRRR